MPTIPEPAPLWQAIIDRLRTSTGKSIGEADAPALVGRTSPYGVFYPSDDERTEGSLSDPLQIVVWAFQVTAVGTGMFQTAWFQRAVRAALIGWKPTVTGVGTTPIELLNGSGITRDDALSGNPTFFYSTDLFTVYTSV